MINLTQTPQAKILKEQLDSLLKIYMEACKKDGSFQVKKDIRIQIRKVEVQMGNAKRIELIRQL